MQEGNAVVDGRIHGIYLEIPFLAAINGSCGAYVTTSMLVTIVSRMSGCAQLQGRAFVTCEARFGPRWLDNTNLLLTELDWSWIASFAHLHAIRV